MFEPNKQPNTGQNERRKQRNKYGGKERKRTTQLVDAPAVVS